METSLCLQQEKTMTEYLLVFAFCSLLDNSCVSDFQKPTFHKDHYSCLLQGYTEGAAIIKKLDIKTTNENKLYLAFGCVPQERI